MKKLYVVTRLVEDDASQDWHLLDNDLPGSTEIFPHLHQANILMNTISSNLLFGGWSEKSFFHYPDIREWREFRKGERRIALVLYEREIDL